MMHEFLSDYFSQRLIAALAFAIFASLKYMTAAALALKILLAIIPRQKADRRYFTGLICLAVGFGFSVSAFGTAWSEGPAGSLGASANSAAENLEIFFLDFISLKINELLTQAESFVLSRADLLSAFWLAGVLFSGLRFSLSFLWLQKIKTAGLSPVSAEWEAVKNRLSQAAGLQQKVGLYLSDRIRSPMTLGHFKPLILIPVGMFAGLSAEQAEAILMHELAHIKRNDYLINLLQSAVELLLFYHPAVHYMSKCIRDERENCCDDAAVSLCGDPPAYARALLHLEADFLAANSPAMAFAGHRFSDRFRRLKRLGNFYKFDFKQLIISHIPQKAAGQGQLSRRVFRLFGNGRPQTSRQLIWFFPLLLFSFLLLFDSAESAVQNEPAVFDESLLHREILVPTDRTSEAPRQIIEIIEKSPEKTAEIGTKTMERTEISETKQLVWETKTEEKNFLFFSENSEVELETEVIEQIDNESDTEQTSVKKTFTYKIRNLSDSALKAGQKRFIIHKTEDEPGREKHIVQIESRQEVRSVFVSEDKLPTSEPIFIVNGKPVSAASVRELASERIQNVQVFKGEKAIEIYGEKGVNGVVELSVRPDGKEKTLIFIDGKKTLMKKEIFEKQKTKKETGRSDLPGNK